MTDKRYVQIGWLGDPLETDDDLAKFIADPMGSFGIEPLDDYTDEIKITHSHGPVTKPIPVYIEWAEGMYTA